MNNAKKTITFLSAAGLLLVGCSADAETEADTDTNGADADTVEQTDSEEQQDDTQSSEGSGEEEGGEVDPASLFDFTSAAARANVSYDGEVTFDVNEPLVEASYRYAEDGIYDSVTIRSVDDPDSQCAIEVEYVINDSAVDRIENDDWQDIHYLNANEDLNQEYLDRLEAAEDAGDYEEYGRIEEEMNSHDKVEAPVEKRWDELPAAQFETIDGTVVGTTSTAMDCAVDAYDDEDTFTIGMSQFRNLDSGDTAIEMQESRSNLATASVNVMASGDLHIVDWGVEGYVQDSQGTWIAESD